ncbi:hypothetical protein ACFSKW_14215 [Nonomuraea mangrovi]|uniref:Transposase n=1 Tax=Nonomuraea mangrovi TaxID=2316207 RepID=A0ABW4SSV7_9ACTN
MREHICLIARRSPPSWGITLRYYALNGADHRSHDEQNAAIGAYVRWRNARAQLKRASPPAHRSETGYPAKVA